MDRKNRANGNALRTAGSEWRRRLEAAALSQPQSAIATRIGTSGPTIGRWLAGEREPSARMKLRIVTLLATAGAKAEPSPPPASRSSGESLARAGLTGRDRFSAIVERIEDEIRACGPNVPRNHVAGLYGQLQAAIDRLARLDGEGELSVAALLRSKAYAEVEAVILEVLRGHPGAAEDLVAALDAVREGA